MGVLRKAASLPRWAWLVAAAELVLTVLTLARGAGVRDLVLAPADLTNQYAGEMTLTIGDDGGLAPAAWDKDLFLDPTAGLERNAGPSDGNGDAAQTRSAELPLLVGGGVALPAGRYQLCVDYAASADVSAQVLPASADAIDVALPLPAGDGRQQVCGTVWLEQPDENLRVVFSASHGDWTLYGITLRRQGWYDLACAAGLLAVFALADLLALYLLDAGVFAGSRQPGRRAVLAVLLGLVALCSLPVMEDAVSYGFDLSFHMSRLAGVAQGLAGGQLPVRIYPNFLNGYGYGSPLFYGDVLLYFPALLILAGMPMFRAYNLLLVGLNALTAAIGWFSFSRMLRGSRAAALTTTALYMTAFYRLFNMYYRPALGETCAQCFLPLILYGFWALWADDVPDPWRKNAWAPLGLGFSGIILTHVITTEIMALAAVCGVLACCKRALRPGRLLTLLKGAGLTVGLCAGFLVPFLQELGGDYRFRADSNAIDPGTYAISVGQLLEPWSSTADSIRLGAPLLLAGAGLLALLAYRRGLPPRVAQVGGAGLVLGGAAVFLAGWTGWQGLADAMGAGIGRMFLNFQFPFRFLILAVLGLSVAGGALVWGLGRLAGPYGARACAAGLVAVCVIFAGLDLIPYVDGWFGRSRDGWTRELSDTATSSAMEYLPASFALEQAQNTGISVSDTVACTVVGHKDLEYTLRLRNDSNDANANLELPLVYYPGYRILQSDGGDAAITRGENGQVALVLAPGYDGTLTVGFAEPLSWRAGEAVSLLTAAGLILWALRRRKQEQRR